MPTYGLPGARITPRRSRAVGATALAIAVVAVLAYRMTPQQISPQTLSLTLVTDTVGAGVDSGDAVRLDGVDVGSITGIEPENSTHQKISLALDRSRLDGVTDALGVDWAPGNLFGVTELVLQPRPGGAPLTDNSVVDLTGANAARVHDVTLSTLLDSLGQLTNTVLTPQMTNLVATIAADTHGFTPFVQTVIAAARDVADTQHLPASYLLDRYAAASVGLPPTLQGLLGVLEGPFTNAYLAQPGKIDKFIANINFLEGPFLGGVTALLLTGRTYYAGLAATVVPLLAATAATVPNPARSTAELRSLLEGIERAMPDTGNGPTLNLAVDLRDVPVVQGPLTQLLTTGASVGGGR